MSAKQREWAQRKNGEKTSERETVKMKRVPSQGSKCDCVDNKDTLRVVITICLLTQNVCHSRNTRAKIDAYFETDQ